MNIRNCKLYSFKHSADFRLIFQENIYWLERILRSYQSRIYDGDLGNAFEVGGIFNLHFLYFV